MRQRIIEAIIIILLLLAVVDLGYWLFRNNPEVGELVLVELELATPEPEIAGIPASGHGKGGAWDRDGRFDVEQQVAGGRVIVERGPGDGEGGRRRAAQVDLRKELVVGPHVGGEVDRVQRHVRARCHEHPTAKPGAAATAVVTSSTGRDQFGQCHVADRHLARKNGEAVI